MFFPQLDEEDGSLAMNWLPHKLAPHVRCVFSMIGGVKQHENLLARDVPPQELLVKPLSLLIRKVGQVGYNYVIPYKSNENEKKLAKIQNLKFRQS